VGLWTRLRDFERAALLAPVHERRLVRGTLMRGTLHLVSARDYAWMRPTLHATLVAGFAAIGTPAGVTADEVARWCERACALLDGRPRTFDELRTELVASGLTGNERALGYAVRTHVPLLQVPDAEAAWGWDAKAPFARAEPWIGAPLAAGASPETLVRRYLAAFGPAAPADATAWSGVRGLRATFDALRPELVVVRDAAGRELFDLPDAPRPPEDAPAPPRFLPDYDNVILGHDDRTRIVPAAYRPRLTTKNLQVPPTFLVDGLVAGTWRSARTRGVATVTVRPFAKLARPARDALHAEGVRLARFLEPEARGHEVEEDE
jgi:hypothetical protein